MRNWSEPLAGQPLHVYVYVGIIKRTVRFPIKRPRAISKIGTALKIKMLNELCVLDPRKATA